MPRPAAGPCRPWPLAAALCALCACAPKAVPPPAPVADRPPPVEREFRGVWVATVANIDWPSRPGLPVAEQQAELLRILDRAAELRLNVVILQVRPAADALYASTLEPWSAFLTGEEGRAPEPAWDPLAFAIEKAHARGLELHAWFNPYRARHPAAVGPAAATHIGRTNPELVRSYGAYLWMDPGEEAVRRRSLEVMLDVVRRYDVDGVHIDDYFYPYREMGPDGRELSFPDSATYARYLAGGGRLDRSEWRRANVDAFVAELYTAVKREKRWVKVGVSPIGTWRPGVAPGLGGFDAYEQIFADARKWLREGDLDYLVPQLYWPIARTDVSFPVLLDWWVRQNILERGLFAGMIPSNVNLDDDPRRGWAPDEIVGQVYVTRGRSGAEGHVHFSMRSLMPRGALGPVGGADTLPPARLDSIRSHQARVQARRDTLAIRLRDEAYSRPALVPAMPWLGAAPPPAPQATWTRGRAGHRLTFEPGTGAPPFRWVVQTRGDAGWSTEILPGRARSWTIAASAGSVHAIAVSAVDRTGNRSEPVRPREEVDPADLPTGVIRHADWAAMPALGHAAAATRRNLPVGGALTFRDLEVTVEDTAVDSKAAGGLVAVARLALSRGAATDVRTVAEGAAIRWGGYRIAVVAIPASGQLGGGLVHLEIATLASLPDGVASASEAGDASLRLRVPHEISRVTLHHTGFPEPLGADEDPVQRLRDLHAWGAADRNWWDVPYHFLIDLDGNVYEGRDWRYKGDTNTTYEPAGHLLVSVLGNYEIQEPTPAQLEAIADVMAWGLDRFDLPADRLGGHYDYAATACPGVHLRELLEDGSLARMVEARRQPRVGPEPAGTAALRTMSFNVRYGTAPDGDDAWPLRRDLALEVVRDFDPHVLGVQEALRFQLDETLEAMPHLSEVGVGRDDGRAAGEHASILYDRRRLDLLDGGTFWLSDTPEVPGSTSWGNRITRIATWARFRDRADDASFLVVNTHWDHESQPARERSADLILERIGTLARDGDAVILMGDFNAGEENPAYVALLSASGAAARRAPPFVDTYRAIRPDDAGDVGTFHAFTGDPGGDKIDGVLVSPHWRVVQAEIVRTHRDGRYPSDHFPVTATVARTSAR